LFTFHISLFECASAQCELWTNFSHSVHSCESLFLLLLVRIVYVNSFAYSAFFCSCYTSLVIDFVLFFSLYLALLLLCKGKGRNRLFAHLLSVYVSYYSESSGWSFLKCRKGTSNVTVDCMFFVDHAHSFFPLYPQ